MTELSDYVSLAKHLVKIGGDIALDSFRDHHFSEHRKADHSYATSTDISIESKLRQEILKSFPNHTVCGEEAGSVGAIDAITWNIDPIDGTHNFMYGVPVFGTMISVTKGDETLCAAAYDPNTNMLFSVVKGEGAFVNERRVEVSTEPDARLDQTTLIVEWGKTATAVEAARTFLYEQAGNFRSFRKYGCIFPAFACTASNHFGALLYFGMDTREISGVALFMAEAGLRVTTHAGGEWNLASGTNIAVSHQQLHPQVMKTIEN